MISSAKIDLNPAISLVLKSNSVRLKNMLLAKARRKGPQLIPSNCSGISGGSLTSNEKVGIGML